MWPKLQQKCQQLHRREERETANDSSSEKEVTTSDEALTPTTSIVEFPNPQFHNEINNNPRPLKVVTFTELREPLDLIDTNDP